MQAFRHLQYAIILVISSWSIAMAAEPKLDSLHQAALENSNPQEKALAWLDLGNYYQMRNHDSVYYYIEQLKAFGEQMEFPLARIYADGIQGRIHHNHGKLESAKKCYHQAILLAQKAKLRIELGGLYLNLGVSHSRGFELDSAVYYIQLAEQHFNQFQQTSDLWRCYSAFANIHIEREDFNQADQDFRKSIEF